MQLSNALKNCKMLTQKRKSETLFFQNFFVFLRMDFLAIFSNDSKSASTSAFFTTQIEFLKKIFIAQISTFCKLCSKTRTKRFKKMKKRFSFLALNFANINPLGQPSCYNRRTLIHRYCVLTPSVYVKSLCIYANMFIVHMFECLNV